MNEIRCFKAWINFVVIVAIAQTAFKFVASSAISSLSHLWFSLATWVLIFDIINLVGVLYLSYAIFGWALNKYIVPQIAITESSDDVK